MLIFLLISACSNSIPPYNISLMTENRPATSAPSNPKLIVKISEKFEHPELIGGDNSFSNITFQEIIPWLRNRLDSINALNCALTKIIRLNISVKKLYTTIDGRVLIGTLVLNAKLATTEGKTQIRNYRGDCKIGFFTLNEKDGIRTCLNLALNLIIPSLKHDLCAMN